MTPLKILRIIILKYSNVTTPFHFYPKSSLVKGGFENPKYLQCSIKISLAPQCPYKKDKYLLSDFKCLSPKHTEEEEGYDELITTNNGNDAPKNVCVTSFEGNKNWKKRQYVGSKDFSTKVGNKTPLIN